MNRTKLKTYAPQARRDFIQAVTDRAASYGLTDKMIEHITENGDVAIIAGRAFPRAIASKRKTLEERIAQYGFGQTMDAIAYTWFNRLVAIRYMELHGYLDHGYRVLSHPDLGKSIPEILEHAEHVGLPGLDKHKVIELKLEGSNEAELYRMLLLAQCNALYKTMPFLFEWIGDETELLFPDNLLHTDSLIRKLVTDIDEEDWQDVEIIGWLYQFYIFERKAEVMARKSAVPTEDIPAVTQLFTPHWIVRYLVENSLGRLWLLNRPGSRLRQHMPYYIEGEAETDFLKITKPEEIRLLDPACGSGHMLTYAFDLLFRIYEEEGYVPNEIPALILKNNLYGMEICPRAAQLAELALVFKAREKSRRFFQPGTLVQPRILALENIHFDEGELRDYIAALDLGDLFNQLMLQLLYQFEQATTFGSLIQPCLDEQNITFARNMIAAKDLGRQLFLRETHGKVIRVLEQAEMLCQRYHVVVANPPYMGGSGMNADLRKFAKDNYADSKADSFAMFIKRSFSFTVPHGYSSMVTMQAWMFLSSYEVLRAELLTQCGLITLIQIGYNSFPEMNSKIAQACAFVFSNSSHDYRGSYVNLNDAPQAADKELVFLDKMRTKDIFRAASRNFEKIPGSPIAYWVSDEIFSCFEARRKISDIAETKSGMSTTDNQQFLRFWQEVSWGIIGFGYENADIARTPNRKWFPYSKGGEFRKWYGNQEYVVNWQADGRDIRACIASDPAKQVGGRIVNEEFYFKSGVGWSDLTSGRLSARVQKEGFLLGRVWVSHG